MELLVFTRAQPNPTRGGEALDRLRQISNTIRNAPGLSNARFYFSGEPENSYLLLTTWEGLEWWQKAQERHSPYRLLQESAAGIFPTPPDQWFMQYLWGYSRPLAKPEVAIAQLALIRPEQAGRVQQGWLASLQEQAVEPQLSFALLARNIESEEAPTSVPRRPGGQGVMFLNLLSWPGETYREDFYADENYQNIVGQLNNAGILRILKLEPVS